jgi:hypothetical protein
MANPLPPALFTRNKTQFDQAYAILNGLVRDEQVVVYLEANFGWKAQEACQTGIDGAECGCVGYVADCFPCEPPTSPT